MADNTEADLRVLDNAYASYRNTHANIEGQLHYELAKAQQRITELEAQLRDALSPTKENLALPSN